MVAVPKVNALTSVILTLFVPLFVNVTAPMKSLLDPLVVKSIANAPVVRLDVPGTTNAPVCVIAPPAVADKLPPLVKVMAGNVIAALLNTMVRLRKFVKPVKLGMVAPALVLRNDTSRILLLVPPNTNADVPKSLACVPSNISEAAVVTATVVVPPVAVIAPDSVILPPAVNDKLRPMLLVPILIVPVLVAVKSRPTVLLPKVNAPLLY